MKKYWISFVEEGIQHPDYFGCVGGRVEVYDYDDDSGYAIDEYRFLTRKRTEFENFRELWDCQDVDGQRLARIALELRMVFQDGVR